MFRGDFRRCPNDGTLLEVGGADPLVSTVLAERYRIEAIIGDGGLGRVYRARHVRMSRRFAIKVPFGDVGYDRKSRARLANEAEAASRLDHPNVIGIVDVGETAEGLFYLAMDLAEGQALADVITDGALPEREALEFLVQICAGLAHAHERGLVHRDLKPDNIVVSTTSDGQALVQIIDFGLALMSDAEGSRLTTDGLVVGTPYYMAPEQATDEPLDQRTDLFALGIILYEMLAGDLPFEGTPTAVARQNLAVELPAVIERSGRAVDPLLDGLIGWMTRKRPSDRPANARAVSDVARAILAGDREGAARMLPESLRPSLAPPTTPAPPAPGDAIATLPLVPAASVDAPVPAREATRAMTTDVIARRAPTARYAALAIGGLAFGALLVVGVRALTRGDHAGATAVRDGGAVPVAATLDAASPVATTLATTRIDAGEAIAIVSIDAGGATVATVRDRDGGRPDRRDVAVTRLPLDAGVRETIASVPPVDARPAPLAFPVDARAAIASTPPADAAPAAAPASASLKALYAQVTSAYNDAVTRVGAARTAALGRRLDALPPYSEALRKPALRAQAEQELRAIARDLAALGP